MLPENRLICADWQNGYIIFKLFQLKPFKIFNLIKTNEKVLGLSRLPFSLKKFPFVLTKKRNGLYFLNIINKKEYKLVDCQTHNWEHNERLHWVREPNGNFKLITDKDNTLFTIFELSATAIDLLMLSALRDSIENVSEQVGTKRNYVEY